MRPFVLAICAATLLAGPAFAAREPRAPVPPGPELTKALAGRVAGKPVSCITLGPPSLQSDNYDGNAIVYKDGNRRWYVNMPDGGHCTSLRRDVATSSRTPTNRLCSGDIIRVFDPVIHMDYGSCGLGEFVPYTKPYTK